MKCWLLTSHLSLAVNSKNFLFVFLFWTSSHFAILPFCHGTWNYWGLPPPHLLENAQCQCLRWRSSQVTAEKERGYHNYGNPWGLCQVKPECMVVLLILNYKSALKTSFLALVDILTLQCDSFPGVDKSKFHSLEGKKTFPPSCHSFTDSRYTC